MNDYLFLVPIILTSIIGVMSPGPSFIFVAQVTLNKSREHGIATSLGLGTGAVIFTLLACFGLFLVLEAAPFLYGALKIMGGIYLLYLAYKIWKSSKADSSDTIIKETTLNNEDRGLRPYIQSYCFGLLTQLSNPKTAIVIGSMIMAVGGIALSLSYFQQKRLKKCITASNAALIKLPVACSHF